MTEEQREKLRDIAADLIILAHAVDPYLESDEMTTLWAQIGRIELLAKE